MGLSNTCIQADADYKASKETLLWQVAFVLWSLDMSPCLAGQHCADGGLSNSQFARH